VPGASEIGASGVTDTGRIKDVWSRSVFFVSEHCSAVPNNNALRRAGSPFGGLSVGSLGVFRGDHTIVIGVMGVILTLAEFPFF